jgi:hypothetical protein
LSPLSVLGEAVEFEWFKVEASRERYSTRAGFEQYLRHSRLPKGLAWKYFEAVDMDRMTYEANHFADGPHAAIDQKSETNTPLKWRDIYVGTMRYQVVATVGDIRVASPGAAELNSRSFEKKNSVHRISKRAKTGNPILDMGFAHGNLPYYYGSNTPKLAWYGSDCAKFVSVVYRETMRPSFAYQSTYSLARKRARAVLDGMTEDGVYTSKGRPVRYGREVRVGDILVVAPSPHHTGLIGEDKNGNGLLDEDDHVLHTLKEAPSYMPIKDAYFGPPSKNLKILKILP